MSGERLAALRAAMEAAGTDLLALGPGPHMQWLLGFHPHADERPCLLLVTPRGWGFLMPALNAEEARVRCDVPLHVWADEDGPSEALRSALLALGAECARRVSVDEAMRADFALLLLGALPGAEPGFAAQTVGRLRMRKDEGERDALRENARLADRAMEAALAAIRPGASEREVADAARAAFAKAGAQPLFAIVGAGGNGARPHHATGDTALAEGDAVVIDIGARRGAFSSDITRMAAVGRPPEGYEEAHVVVEAAVRAALAAARPGVPAREVDRAARSVIEEAGLGRAFVHRTGHGLGLEGHEPPWITATSEAMLEEGMVFSVEPGVYLPRRFGIRLEEIVILGAEGPEVLSRLPRAFHVAR